MDSSLANATPAARPNPRLARPFAPYGFALLLVGLATALTALLWPRDQYAPFGVYYPAVWLATLIGKKPAGLFAAILSTFIGDYLFVPPQHTLIPTPNSVVSVVVFAAVNIVFVLLYDHLQRTKDALEAGEERLRLAMRGARLGSWHWELRSGELVWSDQCRAMFGLAPGTALSYERFLAALHPQDRARVDAAVRHALEARVDYDVEFRTVWPDGTLHWISSRGRGYYDANGHPSRMEGVTIDISGRKEAEEAARQANQQLREQAQVLELAPVLVRDLDSGIVLWTTRRQAPGGR